MKRYDTISRKESIYKLVSQYILRFGQKKIEKLKRS